MSYCCNQAPKPSPKTQNQISNIHSFEFENELDILPADISQRYCTKYAAKLAKVIK